MLQGKKASIAEGQLVKLTKKYGTTAFMYTQYPHKRFWNQPSNDALYRQALIGRFSDSENHATMLYLHMPYCEQLCWFCTCHVSITRSYDKVNQYMQFLKKEIECLSLFLKENNLKPDIKEIHLGGGSPTYINETDFKDMLLSLSKIVDIKQLDEFALEIDPRRVNQDRMYFYAEQGINRISFGIQDFDLKIQESINRVQPVELIENLLTPDIKSKFPNGVNFDVLVGLPHQTSETMKKTCETIIKLSPDRVCMNYMHYSPEFAKHQTIMMDGKGGRPDRLPDFMERKNIFISALNTLTGGGYVRTGYDHFAKPTDANAISLASGKMGWNELGVIPGRVFDCIALGVSSKSTIGDYYFQNYYELIDYENSLNNNVFPIHTQHHLTLDEKIRREVIMTLRNYFRLDYSTINDKYNINFSEYFSEELTNLKDLETDQITNIFDDKIIITELGCQFSNLVCRIFDKYYQDSIVNADTGELPVVQLKISKSCCEDK